MKICILTFHSESNYGANLQAYALNKILLSFGHEVWFIDYRRRIEKFSILGFVRKWVGKSPKATIRKVREQLDKKVADTKFKRFQEDNFRLTPVTYTSPKSIIENPPSADCYIVGSDQVWSTQIVDNIDLPVYLLAFGCKKVKRIAYAVSSGGEEFSPNDHEELNAYLHQFDAIGVREESLACSISKFGLSEIELVPDPTVLIDWSKHIKLDSSTQRNKVGLFILKSKNYTKITLSGKTLTKECLDESNAIINISALMQTPQEWVRTIAALKFLVTDSYHAVLFAIYTKTPFIFVSWGSQTKRDIRIHSLLARVCLSDKIVTSVKLDDLIQGVGQEFNWIDVSQKIEEMRKLGIKFLEKNLSDI